MKRLFILVTVMGLVAIATSVVYGGTDAYLDPYFTNPADCATLVGKNPTGTHGSWTWASPWIAGNPTVPFSVSANNCFLLGLENYQAPLLKEVTVIINYTGGPLTVDDFVWTGGSTNSALLNSLSEPNKLVLDIFLNQPDWEYVRIKATAAAQVTGVSMTSKCRPVPSLTQWGIIGLVLLMLAAGAMVIVRQRRATVGA